MSVASALNELSLEKEHHWDFSGKSNSEKDFIHGICTYPAMMVPKMQREILKVCLDESNGQIKELLDPFAGSGTILVEGMLNGLNITGIDINPLAILLCKAKTTIYNLEELNNSRLKLYQRIDNCDKVRAHHFNGIEKWFTEQAILDLSKIREVIIREDNLTFRRFFWAAFCETVRVVSNSRNSTYKLYIKTKEEISAYNKDALQLFKSKLDANMHNYELFYNELVARRLLNRKGNYRGSVHIILGDSTEWLRHSKKKYDLILTSPPYGDNHTTVSYGQYSVLPLRWINIGDIDSSVDSDIINTIFAIDNISLGGKSGCTTMTRKRNKVVKKSKTLAHLIGNIDKIAPKQKNKVIAFYSDYDQFLHVLSKKMKDSSFSVWTLGNRKVARQEILMDKIMEELCNAYGMKLITSFSRRIIQKRMAATSGYNGDEDGKQNTMTKEHILVFKKMESLNG